MSTIRMETAVARLDDMLDNTATSLRALSGYGHNDGGPDADVDDTVGPTALRLAATLASIQTNMSYIHRVFLDSANCLSLEKQVPPPGAHFHAGLEVCTTSCKALVDRLDSVVSGIRIGMGFMFVGPGTESESELDCELHKGLDYDDDYDDMLNPFELLKENPLRGFRPYVDRLATGVAILLDASSLCLSDQQALLENSASRIIFRQLRQDGVNFVARHSGYRSSTSSLRDHSPSPRRLKLRLGRSGLSSLLSIPPRLTALLGRGCRRDQRQDQEQRDFKRVPLERASTWPLVKSLTKGAERDATREAQKRSALIDKQLETEFNAHRRCTVLTCGSHEDKALLMEHFISMSSTAPGSSANLDVNSPSVVALIRRHVFLEAKSMVEATAKHNWQTCKGVRENLFARTLLEKMEEEGATLNKEIVQYLEDLWQSKEFQTECVRVGRPEAYSNLIMDAIRRVSVSDYVPTPADYRRFSVNQRRTLNRGTYDIDALSVSVFDYSTLSRPNHGLGCCGSSRKVLQLLDNATSMIFLADLAQCGDMLQPDSKLHQILNILDATGPLFPKASIIIILSNADQFKEKFNIGGAASADEALKHVFHRLTAGSPRDRKVYAHVGELLDPATMQFVVAAVKDTMLECALSDAGLLA
ncbi:hypothetical protein B0T17DRAFT_89718 [Bombardia bombarda]|uniref:Uncharacterized protein n=1 Tax=Bombardia bombarda TaxID=252184 RepID=A0AA39XMH3_9PEZI|nr:hypothetical protein B0T17DRAFT_89718 [Bombardia bombarda]